jgi:hypothetical protein
METYEMAAAVAEAAGISAAEIAARAGFDRTYTWRQLNGERGLQPEVEAAVIELVGERVAEARAPVAVARAVATGV